MGSSQVFQGKLHNCPRNLPLVPTRDSPAPYVHVSIRAIRHSQRTLSRVLPFIPIPWQQLRWHLTIQIFNYTSIFSFTYLFSSHPVLLFLPSCISVTYFQCPSHLVLSIPPFMYLGYLFSLPHIYLCKLFFLLLLKILSFFFHHYFF